MLGAKIKQPDQAPERFEARFVNWIQLVLLVAGSTTTILLTSFATFVTKDSLEKEIELREKFRDEQMSYIRDQFRTVNDKLDRIQKR